MWVDFIVMTDCFLAVLGFSRLFREKGFFFFYMYTLFVLIKTDRLKKKKTLVEKWVTR